MGVCILGMGECGSTSTSIATSNKTLITEALTSMITNTTQTVTATIKASQTASIKIKGDVKIRNCPGSLNITQGLKVTQDIKLNLKVTSGNDLKTQVANAISTLQTSDTTQKQGFLTTASVASNTSTNINDFIKNVVSNDVWTTTAQSLSAIIQAFQTGTFEVDGIFDCENSANSGNILQNAIVEQLVSVIMNALYSNVVGVAIDNKDESEQTMRTKQDNSGLGGLISDIINTLAKLVGGAMLGTFLFMMCPCIVLICCACVLCGGKHHFGNKPSQFGKGLSKFGNDLKKVSKF
jgi:hypothetical protein